MSEADGAPRPLKQALAERLRDRFPGAWHDLQRRRRPGWFEPESFLLPALCAREGVAVAAGAGVAGYAREMARWSAAVVVVEPNAGRWPELRRMAGGRLRLEAFALSDRPGGVALRRPPEDQAPGPAAPPERVHLRPLDHFQLRDVACIRLDLGGQAVAVVEGARETLAACRPTLLIRCDGRPGLVAELERLGYEALVLSGRELRPLRSPSSGAEADRNVVFLPVERTDTRTRLARLAAKLPLPPPP